MLRWMILSVSFVLWTACMALVYVNFKPAPRADMDTDTRVALEHLFDPAAPEHRIWKIYADPADLEDMKAMLGSPELPGASKPRKVEWNGVDEKRLVLAGRLNSIVKNKRESSLDEETRLNLSLPGTPFEFSYKGSGHVAADSGLEYCKFSLKLKYDTLEIEARSAGNRDGDAFNFTTVLTQNGNVMYNNTRREDLGGKAAPNAELAPFQYNPEVKPGAAWDVRMIDFNAAMKGEKDFMRVLKVKCMRSKKIIMDGDEVLAFEVFSENGEARAWYSPDGEVLKQSYKLAGMFDIMVVKEDEKKTK